MNHAMESNHGTCSALDEEEFNEEVEETSDREGNDNVTGLLEGLVHEMVI